MRNGILEKITERILDGIGVALSLHYLLSADKRDRPALIVIGGVKWV